MDYEFPEYPENWNDMRDAMFKLYGGKYCIKGIFMKLGHEGFVNIHHAVPLSKAAYQSEYYFLNSPWNLIPLCEKHHIGKHRHLEGIKGVYKPFTYKNKGKIRWARRFGWYLKRKWYSGKFEKRRNDDKILWFWNYWQSGERKLKRKMESWPGKCLEDLL